MPKDEIPQRTCKTSEDHRFRKAEEKPRVYFSPFPWKDEEAASSSG